MVDVDGRCLVQVMIDGEASWFESVEMLVLYGLYILLMKFALFCCTLVY